MGLNSGAGFAGTSAGGGSDVTLTRGQVAFGSASNTITSSSNFTYDNVSQFSVGFGGDAYIRAQLSGGFITTGMGDLDLVGFETYLQINDSDSQIKGNGLYTNSESIITYSGTGLNDLSTGGAYTGSIANFYVVSIDGEGTPDTFDWSDTLGNFGTNVPITGSAQALSFGVTITFGATTGHNGTENWSWNYTVTYGDMLLLDGQNHTYAFGDVSSIYTGAVFEIIEQSSLYWGATIGDNLGSYLVITRNSNTNTYQFGDISDVNNNTYISVNDTNSVVISTNAIATPTMKSYTDGDVTPNVTIDNGVRGLIYDPASIVSAATITMPSSPVDGQEVLMVFGGQINAGTVVTTLTVSPNTSQHVIVNIDGLTSMKAGYIVLCKYVATGAIWYVSF